MQTLQLDGATARRLYPSAVPELKEILDKSFGKEFFSQKVEDRIHSVQDACKETGRDINQVIPFPKPINQFQDWLNANAEMAVIIEAFNENKIPDWKDDDQEKYRGWWRMDGSSGSGLSFNAAVYDISVPTVASRLHLLNEKHLLIIKDRFFSIWERLMTQSAK